MIQRCPSLAGSPPALEFCDDLHGVGGLFDSANWVIMIGVRDMQLVAAEVVRRRPKKLARLYKVPVSTPAAQLVSRTVRVATVRCMAHEIGHALIFRGAPNPHWPDDEAGADHYAGMLDAARGESREFGKAFFFSIGCTRVGCSHPPPTKREAAYDAGADVIKKRVA
jgi:hypothetical protein